MTNYEKTSAVNEHLNQELYLMTKQLLVVAELHQPVRHSIIRLINEYLARREVFEKKLNGENL